MSSPDPWWAHLTAEQTEALNQSARNSPMPIHTYPYNDAAMAAELLAWKDLEIEILGGHGRWLAWAKNHVESRGREWTHTEFLRICHLEDVSDG